MNVTTPRNVGMNKGTPRIWLEGNKLHEAGFAAGTRFNVEVKREVIELTLAAEGEKKVTGKKTDDPTYRQPVIDLHNASLGDFLKGTMRVNVTYRIGLIVIRRIAE